MKYLALNMIILVAIATGIKAQDNKSVEKPDFANWMIESNVKTPKNVTIRFYNARQELIYQEEITGRRININRKKVRTTLNHILAQLTMRNDKLVPYNLVATSFKQN